MLKGSLCSINGNKYEKIVYNIIRNCTINNKKFNIQTEKELGGSSSKNDIECIFNTYKLGIEIKKYNTPDWMQCSLKYNMDIKKWEASIKGRIPTESQSIFNNLINNINIFNGEVPPFYNKNITYLEWYDIKKNTNKWNDIYIDIPSDTIRKIYEKKGCYYIQISEYGLYHLGNDICNFDVPLFEIEQRMRIRIKIHNKQNKKGFCKLSVTASCQPKNIKLLNKSKYSLDNKDKLPLNLIYKI